MTTDIELAAASTQLVELGSDNDLDEEVVVIMDTTSMTAAEDVDAMNKQMMLVQQRKEREYSFQSRWRAVFAAVLMFILVVTVIALMTAAYVALKKHHLSMNVPVGVNSSSTGVGS
jgi:hypothetical protein